MVCYSNTLSPSKLMYNRKPYNFSPTILGDRAVTELLAPQDGGIFSYECNTPIRKESFFRKVRENNWRKRL